LIATGTPKNDEKNGSKSPILDENKAGIMNLEI
jgi:hypothetical protein